MSAVNLNNVYESIQFYNPSLTALVKVGRDWRDVEPTFVRKVTCGAALAASGLLGFVDAVVSIALTILTLPLELGGFHFSKSFLKRAILGAACSGINLTTAQYHNLFSKKLHATSVEPLSSINQRLDTIMR